MRVSSHGPLTKVLDNFGGAIGTHPGLKRSRNEDRAVFAHVTNAAGEQFSVALLCDGVGGSEMGDVAATLVVTAFLGELATAPPGQALQKLLLDLVLATDNVVRRELSGRGATTASIFLASSRGEVAATNIGDSRIFSWSAGEHVFSQISRDDTLENELKDFPDMDVSALKARGLGDSLSQAIGETGRTAKELQIRIFNQQHFPTGIIMASDGAWKMAPDGFSAVVKYAPSAVEAVKRVTTIANWAGGGDNVSIIAIQDINNLIKASENSARSTSKKIWITIWYGDTKLVICEPADPYINKFSLNKNSSPDQHSLAEKKARRGSSERKKTKLKRNQPQLDLNITDGSGFDPKAAANKPRPKIEISIDSDSSET